MMESLCSKVQRMQISMDILDGYNSRAEERHKKLLKKLKSDFENIEKVKIMLLEYEECLEHQKDIENSFFFIMKKLTYIMKYFPRGLVRREDSDEEEVKQEIKTKTACTPNFKRNAMEKQEERKQMIMGSTKKNLSDRPNIAICITQDEPMSAKKEEPIRKEKIAQDISVSYVVDEEFSSVSSYMKGRLTLSVINEFIDIFNSTLNKKYDLLKKPKKLKSKPELQQCLVWMEQETGELVGTYFCTAEDFDKLSAIKIGNKKYINIITILRHMKRMKEIRVMKMIYYVACF